MKKEFIYLLFSLIAMFSSCSTDLDVVGNYKETMVVYGLLDQSQSKQYIKINKAFLGEGNSFTYAQIKDSVQFVNVLSVTLNYKNRFGIDTIVTLQPDNTIPKDPGIFYSPDQANAIYSFNSTPSMLPANSTYKLIIKNNETGTEVSSKTSLISDFGNFISPAPNSLNFNFVIANSPNYRFFVKWNSGKNAKVYQATIRFNYIDSTITGNVAQHLDWVFPEQQTQSLIGAEPMSIDFRGQDFLQFIGNQLSDYAGLYARRALKVDIILVAAGDELNTFIEVNKPSTGIIQQKPEYSNITNGMGVFSSRYNKLPVSKPISSQTTDSLACGQYTKTLKFENALGILPNCP